MRKFIVLSAAAALLATAHAAEAADVSTPAGTAGTLVNVKLSESNASMDMSLNMGLGLGMKGDMSKAVMMIDADRFAVPAGLVTFKVTNVSTGMVHEMIVAPIANMSTPLSYNDKENRVDEEATHDLGEVSELDPGKSGELTIELKTGLYVLYCNLPGHYGAGMWRVIAVQ